MAEKILVIDDKREITWLFQRDLEAEGYAVEVAHDGREGLRIAFETRPDLILLDVMMPEMNGWEMLGRLREFSDVPVIMVTAMGEENHKVQGFNIGADDYVTKPFGMRELKARIRAALRRVALSSENDSPILRFGELIIDSASQRVARQGQLIDLTPTEYKLLIYLAYNAGRVLTSDQILDNVWGSGYEGNADSVKLYIWYLRRKIEVDPRNPAYILTQRGVGYYFVKL